MRKTEWLTWFCILTYRWSLSVCFYIKACVRFDICCDVASRYALLRMGIGREGTSPVHFQISIQYLGNGEMRACLKQYREGLLGTSPGKSMSVHHSPGFNPTFGPNYGWQPCRGGDWLCVTQGRDSVDGDISA